MYDDLYEKSQKNYKFKDLLPLIASEANVLSAYRNIKKNKGSKTSGTNKRTIIDVGEENPKALITYVKNRLLNYKPHAVRRFNIPKSNGKMRPLGIPTIEDRLIQQCINQILEPICEAKFHPHSYGFRPNRGTHHAIARVMGLINISKQHYVVDVDIKGFFDNVNHSKLLKQMWSLGIQDKNLLCVMRKLLKAEIKGEGIPSKGTPQGGVISPLLSNIVLNELDWWISNQWETFETKRKYDSNHNKYRALKDSKSKLKEIYIVRYADDFKILCRDYKTARVTFEATKKWLEERLSLTVSPEKSKVVNLKKNYSEFLGIKMKVRDKAKKKVVISHICDKATERIFKTIKVRIRDVAKSPCVQTVNKYNSTVLGMQNYYRVATHVNKDFSNIAFLVKKKITNKTRQIGSNTGNKSKVFNKYYGKYNMKTIYIAKTALFPISGVVTKPPRLFAQKACDYTVEGRKIIHERLNKQSREMVEMLLKNSIENESIEFNDNKIALFVGQAGKCAISNEVLSYQNMVTYRKKKLEIKENDQYKNLIIVTKEIYALIQEREEHKAKVLLNKIRSKIISKKIDKLNELRLNVGNCTI